MSSKKGKTKVSQNDLRRMMQQAKAKRNVPDPSSSTTHNYSASIKRVHQLGDGNKLASKKIKLTETLKKDLQKIASVKPELANALKSGRLVGSSLVAGQKRHNHSENGGQTPSSKLAKVQPPKSSKGSSLILSNYSDSSSDEEDSIVPITNFLKPGHPDAGEAGPSSSKSDSKPSEQDPTLPEGFFDDPEVDAKMRGVETPADKMDREWESFQRELQHEEGQSEQLIEEEKETGHLDREIEEIDEQIKLYNLVEKLSDKKDTTIKKLQTIQHISKDVEELSSGSDMEEDMMLDWREKDAFT